MSRDNEREEFYLSHEDELNKDYSDLEDWMDDPIGDDEADADMARRYEAGLGTPYRHVIIPMPERHLFSGLIFKAELQGEHNFVFPCFPLPTARNENALLPMFANMRYHIDSPASAEGRYGEDYPAWVTILGRQLWKVPGCRLVWIENDEVGMHTNGVISDEEVAVMVREIVVPTLYLRQMEATAPVTA